MILSAGENPSVLLLECSQPFPHPPPQLPSPKPGDQAGKQRDSGPSQRAGAGKDPLAKLVGWASPTGSRGEGGAEEKPWTRTSRGEERREWN